MADGEAAPVETNDAPLLSDDAPADKAAPNGADTSAQDKAPDAAPTESKPEAKGEEEANKSESATADKGKSLLGEDEDDKSPDKKAGAPGDAKKDGESEAYQPFTLPEGMQLDEDMVAKATPVLRRLNVSQEDAQELVSIVADRMQQAVNGVVEQTRNGFAQLQTEWKSAALADAELGNGDKTVLAQKLGGAKEVLRTFATPEFRSQVKEWGWENSPEFIRFLHRVRSKLSEDAFVDARGSSQPKAPTRAADIMYGD
jgi:hypothetical protein